MDDRPQNGPRAIGWTPPIYMFDNFGLNIRMTIDQTWLGEPRPYKISFLLLYYLQLGVRLPFDFGLGLLLVHLVDGGRHVGGRQGRLPFLSLLFAPALGAARPLAQTLRYGQARGERVVDVMNCVPVIWIRRNDKTRIRRSSKRDPRRNYSPSALFSLIS